MSGTRVKFEKWEGLGNDFVLIESEADAWTDEQVRAVCDRRRGVGADGVLFVTRGGPAVAGAHPRMVVRNADGSRPEMCGNGIRCVAGYLRERAQRVAIRSHGPTDDGAGAFAASSAVVTIATDAGPKRCDVTGADGAFEVAVAMGPARIEGTLAVDVGGVTHRFTRGDVGNPHAITFEAYDAAAVDRVGPSVATAPAGGTNVEFCEVVRGAGGAPERVDVVVWERGVGRTLACGTGACAVASAACAAGYFAYGEAVRVRLPGGDLSIVVAPGTSAATMRGPARRVFTGELEIP